MNQAHFLDENAALTDPFRRELWQPDRHEQLAAIEVLLASTLPSDLRSMLRERELMLSRRTAP